MSVHKAPTGHPEPDTDEEGVAWCIDGVVEVMVADVHVSVKRDGANGQERTEAADEADAGHRLAQRPVLQEVHLTHHEACVGHNVQVSSINVQNEV